MAAHSAYVIWYLHGKGEDGEPFLMSDGIGVGYGARPFAAGNDAVYLVAQENYPAEFVESIYPVRLRRYAINPTVYASHPPLPTTAHHSLPGGALPPYRGRSFTGRIASASPDAPEPEVRIQFSPAKSRANSSTDVEATRSQAGDLILGRRCAVGHWDGNGPRPHG
jgi:hypothetical protein